MFFYQYYFERTLKGSPTTRDHLAAISHSKLNMSSLSLGVAGPSTAFCGHADIKHV